MGQRGRIDAAERGRRLPGRDRTFSEIDLLLWKSLEGRHRYAEALGEQRRGNMAEPVRQAKSSKFGEVAVVKHEDELARLVAKALQHVAITPGKIPDIPRPEIVDAGAARWVDHRGPHPAGHDIGPFGRRGMPVQFPHHARLKPHRHPGDTLRDRQLLDRRLLAKAASLDAAPRLLQREGEFRQSILGEQGIGNVVHEGGVTGSGTSGRAEEAGGTGQGGYPGEEVPAPGSGDRDRLVTSFH